MGRPKTQARARNDADVQAASGRIELGGLCGAPLSQVRKKQEGTCRKYAGLGTFHPGIGPCRTHGGNGAYWRTKGAWLMGHMLAQGKNITPWEALLGEVRRTYGAVLFYDQKVAEAPDDDSVMAGGSHYPWVTARERERDRLMKVSKLALDAGVAAAQLAQVEWEAQELALMLQNILQSPELGLTDNQLDLARGVARRELMALDLRTRQAVEGPDAVEGEWYGEPT
jgi:hypothetical protein